LDRLEAHFTETVKRQRMPANSPKRAVSRERANETNSERY
jgi:hypothetical protein